MNETEVLYRQTDPPEHGIVETLQQSAPLSLNRDRTGRMRAEQALRKSEEKSRREWMTIFQAIGHPTVIMDPEYRVIQANQAICRILGKSETELFGKHCYELFHDHRSEHPPAECPIRKMLISGMVETVEMEMELLGKRFIVSVTPLLDDRGQIQKIIHIATDITYLKESEEEKKKLQDRLIQIQKMEAIGTLAGGIAHDFNNILMGLQGHISMFLHDMNPEHPYRVKLENMESYIRRGADLTKQLLGFARGGKYDVKPTNMNELLGKSADLFGRTRKEISIYRSFSEDLWTVDVDQGQMDQVFLNLFVNASHAMPGGGNLDLQTDNIVFSETDVKMVGVTKGRYVRISVTDDGVGMDTCPVLSPPDEAGFGIFALKEFTPAAFYILDEIDAHLDAYHVSKLADVLLEESEKIQFIVITLKPEMVNRAQRVYGVYERNGVSSVITTKFLEATH